MTRISTYFIYQKLTDGWVGAWWQPYPDYAFPDPPWVRITEDFPQTRTKNKERHTVSQYRELAMALNRLVKESDVHQT